MNRLSRVSFPLLMFLLTIAIGCSDSAEPIAPPAIKPLVASVQSTAGSWSFREDYSYHEDGRLATVTWERHTPFTTSGSEAYFYDDSNNLTYQIKKIGPLVDKYVYYTYFDGRIVSAASYEKDKKVAYQIFEYNSDGRLALVENAQYNAEANGYDRTDESRYTYHADGNLHTVTRYDFIAAEARLVWSSTKTYESYHSSPNLLSAEDVYPGMQLQKNLPLSYMVASPPSTQTYSFSYELDSNGYPLKRQATYSDGTTEETIYTYQESDPF